MLQKRAKQSYLGVHYSVSLQEFWAVNATIHVILVYVL